mmetsp:Transcript_16663/g.40704  ORF Transcript_16663/g.40704 Transcript_16663/m.40704 type:complete len:85 (+) Transcript_16663:1728-1982(+)
MLARHKNGHEKNWICLAKLKGTTGGDLLCSSFSSSDKKEDDRYFLYRSAPAATKPAAAMTRRQGSLQTNIYADLRSGSEARPSP